MTAKTDAMEAVGRLRICFVAPTSYGALCGGTSGTIGGIQWQQAMMAKWLAARGQNVSMVTWDEGQADGGEIDGVRVFKTCRRNAGLPGVRFFHPRWTGLNAAMGRADADLYYQNCAECVTGQVTLWCRRHGRKFVYSVASDPDCDRRLPEMHTLREQVLYRYGLRHADRVIVQTRRQQDMLRSGFGRESAVIAMPCQGPMNGQYVAPQPPVAGKGRVLWLGRICEVKRPDRLVELARACPELAFDFVGPMGDGEYPRRAVEQAKALPNVAVHGRASRAQVPGFYQRAACLVCTSAFEGFPNTFLEAWSHGRPVVSTFDPDNLIATRGLGAVAGDVPGLAAALRQIIGSSERYRQASQNARRYYLENHAVETVMPQFERLFLDVVSEPWSRGEKRK